MIELYEYQKTSLEKLVAAINTHSVALDASDTGTGKTFVGLAVAKALGKSPLVICPKSVITAWKRAAEEFGIQLLDVYNIEKLKTGKTPHLKKTKGGKKTSWFWTLPRGSLVIVDECHIMSGRKSDNSKILAATKLSGYQVLMLSATAADSPLKMKAIGYLLGLHQYKDFSAWCLRNGCYINLWGGLDYSKKEAAGAMKKLHAQIFPAKGSRMRIATIEDFPETSIIAEAYDLAERDADEINAIYAEMDEAVRRPENASTALVEQLRARQKIELIKVPLLVELAEAALDENNSIVIFVSFKDTLDKLASYFQGNCVVIEGGQSQTVRDSMIYKFQEDEKHVCLCTIQAGGLGVSLHDIRGERPRVSFLTPTFNAVEMKQALGRIHRAGAKSKSLQYIVFAAGTVEEHVCKNVKRKLNQIASLNDGDLAVDSITLTT